MPRISSPGQCVFCKREFSKSGMTRHLETCRQREESAGATAKNGQKSQKRRKTKKFHLLVEGLRLPEYWMHLEVTTGSTLADLDRFLRNTWLECCGHLSAFRIVGVSYNSHGDMGWDMTAHDMSARLDKVLTPKLKFTHEYDFGTTTELNLKVVSEWEVEAKGKAIEIIARNDPPKILCGVCGKLATQICTEHIYSEEGWLCDECMKAHECGGEMVLPVVNSPRVGECGYTGQDSASVIF